MAEETDSVGKAADATKEVANATGKAIDTLRDAGGFFSRIFGGLVEDGVGLVADRLKFYRMERALLLAEKTEQILLERGIDRTREVAPNVAIPLLENATLEEDDQLHDLWAKLLSNAMDPDTPRVDRTFVSILSDLTHSDAALLKRAEGMSEGLFSHSTSPIKVDDLLGSDFLGSKGGDEISFFNLLRLGLIFPSYSAGTRHHTQEVLKEGKPSEGGFFSEYRGKIADVEPDEEIIAVRISPLGHAFLNAVA